jgi:sulfite reductase alpha subunit-like flavoprotein
MEKSGAKKIVDIGLSDVKSDLFGPWEDWVDRLISVLVKSTGARSVAKAVTEVIVRESKLHSILGGKEMNIGTVVANLELAGTEVGPSKRQIDIRLPDGMSYTAGDYLVVQPRNPDETVQDHPRLSYLLSQLQSRTSYRVLSNSVSQSRSASWRASWQLQPLNSKKNIKASWKILLTNTSSKSATASLISLKRLQSPCHLVHTSICFLL